MAIYLGEEDAHLFQNAIRAADRAVVGAPTAFEFMLVALSRKDVSGLAEAERLLRYPAFEIVEWTSDLAFVAAQALRRFGKGRHPAKLNFGDCMAYAVARARNIPLLYKGADFAQTDIRSAL